MHADAAPTQKKCAGKKTNLPRTGKLQNSAGQLKNPAEQPLRGGKVGKNIPQPDAICKGIQNGKEDHKPTDLQQCRAGAADRLRKGTGKGHRRGGRPSYSNRRRGGRGEQNSGAERSQHMDAVERKTGARASKNDTARNAEKEGRAGIVAEAKGALRALLCDLSTLIERNQCGGATG